MVVGRNSSGVGETDGVGFDDLADGLLEGDGEVPVRGRLGGFVPSSWFLVLCSLFFVLCSWECWFRCSTQLPGCTPNPWVIDCGTPLGAYGAVPQPKAVSNHSDPSWFVPQTVYTVTVCLGSWEGTGGAGSRWLRVETGDLMAEA